MERIFEIVDRGFSMSRQERGVLVTAELRITTPDHVPAVVTLSVSMRLHELPSRDPDDLDRLVWRVLADRLTDIPPELREAG